MKEQLTIPFSLEKIIFTDSGYTDEEKLNLLKCYQNRFRGHLDENDESINPHLKMLSETFFEQFLFDRENIHEREQEIIDMMFKKNEDKEKERKQKNNERQKRFKEKKRYLTLNNVINVTGNLKETEEEKKRESNTKSKEEEEEKEKKENIVKEKTKTKRFVKPTIQEIREYCQKRKNNVNPESFFDFYESKGWVVGKSPMKSWQAAVRTWERTRNYGYDKKPDVVAERELAEKQRIDHKKLDDDFLKKVEHLL